MSRLTSRHPLNLYYHGGEYVKICGSQDGYFPDFGHHLAGEMGGVWLHPIKLLDGFWLKVTDLERGISVWARADAFVSEPWGGRFEYDHWLGHIPVSIERSQFAPEREKGFVADYRVFANAGLPVRLRLELLVRTDLRPVWFSEQAGVVDGDRDVPVEIADRQVLVKDQDNSWFVRVGTDLPGTAVEADPELYGPEFTAGAGCGISFAAEVELQAGETFDFRLFAAGSYTSREECDRSYELISQRHEALLAEKQALYREIAERASLEIEGEPGLNEAFAWAKWNNQWLVQTVDGLGRGLTAGGPTYPWWFGCDSTYALQGVLAIGDPGLARDTLDLLLKKSEETNGNGRVVHEITTLGAVANPGNTQETAHYIAFVWEMFQWTGDEALLRRHYDYCVKGIEWLLGEMDPDGDLFPSGYGIIEIAGLNMELIDSAVYTAQALRAMAAMSGFFGEHERSAKYGELAERAAEAVNRVFWREADGLYADAVAPREMVAAKREAMVSLAEKHGVAGYGEYMERILQDTAGQEGRHPLAAEQKLGDRHADGGGHRRSGQSRQSAGNDAVGRFCRRVWHLSVRHPPAGDDDDFNRRPCRGRSGKRAPGRGAGTAAPDAAHVLLGAARLFFRDVPGLRLRGAGLDPLRAGGAGRPRIFRRPAAGAPARAALKPAAAGRLA
ncbi:glycogen debranching protein [Paenibacillus macerans]|uniref:alpha-L-rhamnosidase-related protein n=1 Tax=Paenibacillus macerans TaxID=44252 RepID=UPI0022E0F91A|nr:glycogen debranching protein [Paenibacillus macerans]